MDKTSHEKLHCSIALAVTTIGDLWSSLILRDLMIFGGSRRFEQLREGLGISRNVLTDRLNNLLAQDIVKKIPLETGAKRRVYKLTAKGWALMPVLLSIHQWCECWRSDPSNSALKFVEVASGEEIAPIGLYSPSGKRLEPNDIAVVPRTERARDYLAGKAKYIE